MRGMFFGRADVVSAPELHKLMLASMPATVDPDDTQESDATQPFEVVDVAGLERAEHEQSVWRPLPAPGWLRRIWRRLYRD